MDGGTASADLGLVLSAIATEAAICAEQLYGMHAEQDWDRALVIARSMQHVGWLADVCMKATGTPSYHDASWAAWSCSDVERERIARLSALGDSK